MVNLIELPISAIEVVEDTPFLADYFSNIFAEALVPINPSKWPIFSTGSAIPSDSLKIIDNALTPLENLRVANFPNPNH